jgi:hypothetical protein
VRGVRVCAGAGRGLRRGPRAEELAQRGLQLVRGRVQPRVERRVGRVIGAEADLLHARVAHHEVERELRHAEDLLGRAEALVDREVPPEHAHQLARVADRDEPPDAPLAARLTQERLLPGGADEVVVGVAVADVVERVLPVELLDSPGRCRSPRTRRAR